tara:strand:+ start:264 stop:923 length:660 start_codon:yes stop_codon:yes gene_type:complete
MISKNYSNRLFGRTRGRANKKITLKDYQNIIEKYQFKELKKNNGYILDIGTGYGESTIYLAKKNKNKTIISCEKYIDGNLNLIKNINEQCIDNIKLHSGNVYDVLEKSNKKKFFEFVFILFPDPWPKKKHFKRRLITTNFLRILHHNLSINGQVFIATDSISYTRQILKNIYETKNLYKWINQNQIHLKLLDYFNLKTKFYNKATKLGVEPIFLILKKI